MSAEMTGALVGAVFGIAAFLLMRWIAARTEQDETKKGTASMIRVIGVVDLIFFPAMGYLLGPSFVTG